MKENMKVVELKVRAIVTLPEGQEDMEAWEVAKFAGLMMQEGGEAYWNDYVKVDFDTIKVYTARRK